MSSSFVTRRLFLSGIAVGVADSFSGKVEAKEQISVAAHSPFIASGVAVSHEGVVFLGLPRFPGMEKTPSVARVNNRGEPVPFPGGRWNTWQKGKNGSQAFVMVNAIHLFRDNTLWVVDQGAPVGSQPEPGAQKLVQLDVKTGDIMQVLSFSAAIMPPGARFNDLRIHGDLIFVTDSGLGGVIVHNLSTGKTLRRLSGQKVMRNDGVHLHRGDWWAYSSRWRRETPRYCQ